MLLTLEEVSAVVRADPGWVKESKQTRAHAVALTPCESGAGGGKLNSEASNDIKGGHFGLWQISLSNWRYLFTGHDWRNPRDNAAMAYAVFKKQGWTAWSCHSNGSWLATYPRALALENQPVAMPSGVDLGGIKSPQSPLTPSLALPPGYEGLDSAITQLLQGIGGINAMLDFITDKGNWLRVAAFIGGGALILVGLIVMLKETGTARTAAALAPGPIGKAVRTVT